MLHDLDEAATGCGPSRNVRAPRSAFRLGSSLGLLLSTQILTGCNTAMLLDYYRKGDESKSEAAVHGWTQPPDSECAHVFLSIRNSVEPADGLYAIVMDPGVSSPQWVPVEALPDGIHPVLDLSLYPPWETVSGFDSAYAVHYHYQVEKRERRGETTILLWGKDSDLCGDHKSVSFAASYHPWYKPLVFAGGLPFAIAADLTTSPVQLSLFIWFVIALDGDSL